jgi:putative transposase
MNATLEDVTKKKQEPTAEELAVEEIVRRAREQGLSLTGPDGLLKQLTKTVLETALNQELTGTWAMRSTAGRSPGQAMCGTGPSRRRC